MHEIVYTLYAHVHSIQTIIFKDFSDLSDVILLLNNSFHILSSVFTFIQTPC